MGSDDRIHLSCLDDDRVLYYISNTDCRSERNTTPMIHRILKGLAPLAALAGAALVTGCDNMNIRIGDGDGVPLAELDMSGAAPTGRLCIHAGGRFVSSLVMIRRTTLLGFEFNDQGRTNREVYF